MIMARTIREWPDSGIGSDVRPMHASARGSRHSRNDKEDMMGGRPGRHPGDGGQQDMKEGDRDRRKDMDRERRDERDKPRQP